VIASVDVIGSSLVTSETLTTVTVDVIIARCPLLHAKIQDNLIIYFYVSVQVNNGIGIAGMRSKVDETVRCPSVRPSVCPSVCPTQNGTAANPLLQVCCCGPGGQEIAIDCCSSGVRWANAGSAA